MNAKGFFADGLPQETYGQGVRRRVRSMGIVWAIAGASFAIAFAAFPLTGSSLATVVSAFVLGILGAYIDVFVDPIQGEWGGRQGTLFWLLLFGPAAIALSLFALYLGSKAASGFEVFQASLPAWLSGGVVGFTGMFLRVKNEAKA